jgi:flagella basal body P-ring formation protein FlgA
MLRPIILVRTGQIVTIYYDRKGFSIKNEGKALENGGLREKIKVKLPNSGNTITAIVQAPGIVKIP